MKKITLSFQVELDEAKRLRAAAIEARMSLSEYIRHALLDAEVRVEVTRRQPDE